MFEEGEFQTLLFVLEIDSSPIREGHQFGEARPFPFPINMQQFNGKICQEGDMCKIRMVCPLFRRLVCKYISKFIQLQNMIH